MEHSQVFVASRQRKKKTIIILAVMLLLIIIAFIVSMNSGHMKLGPITVLKTLFGYGTKQQSIILFEFRLPRIVISMLVGAGLAVSGCILQGISRNALADPGILGINAGAGLMVMLYVSFFTTATIGSIFLVPVLALIGAGATAALIYTLAYKKNEGISPIRLILTGIAVAAGISSVMIVLTLKLNPDKYQMVATWLAGSIWGANWSYVLSLLPWIVILLPLAMYKAKIMNVLSLGDQMAAGLGAPIERERIMLLAIAVGLSGASVAVSGGIGFVGLIGPHLAKRIVGPQHQFLIPASALVGSLLMLVSDTVGRVILQPSEIPTGIVVAVLGAPYFLYLLAKSKS